MIALLGCAWIDPDEARRGYDKDGDGVPWPADCDDRDPSPCPMDEGDTPVVPDTTVTTRSPDPGTLPPGDRLAGVGAHDGFGAAISAGVDVTHDGVPDLLVGAPGTGLAWFVESVWTQNSVSNVGIPLGSGEDCGSAVLLTPDIDGDDLGEAVIACPSMHRVERWWPGGDRRGTWELPAAPGALANVGPKLIIAVPEAERVLVVPVGAYGAVDLDDAIGGLRDGDGFGGAVVTGDFDGTGVPQLAVLAPAGRRLDLFTQPFATSAADAAGSITLGRGVPEGATRAGDVDGDGIADLVLSDPSLAALAFFHAPGGPVDETAAFAELYGMEAGFGARVAGVGDVDADGVDDVLVADPEAQEGAGVVWLLHGPPGSAPLGRVVGPEGAAVGTTVAGAGDRDEDGRADMVVSGRDGELGVVWLFHGGSW